MLIAAALVLAWQAHPLSSALFPQPGGDNALEEYAQAADAIANPRFARLNSELSKRSAEIGFPQISIFSNLNKFADLLKADAVAEMPGETPRDFVKMCEEERKQCAAAMELIRAGNLKPVRSSGALHDNEDLIFNLVPFLKTLGNVALRTSYADYATGHGTQGVQTLVDFLELADRLTRASLTGADVGLEVEGKTCALGATLLRAMSLADCQALDSALRPMLAGRSTVEDQADYLCRLALERIPREVQRFANMPAEGTAGQPIPGEISDTVLEAEIKGLSPTQRGDAIAQAMSLIKTATAQYMVRFSNGESAWLDPLPANDLFQPGVITQEADIATQLAAKYMPRVRPWTRFLVVARERLRLLNIHARIRAFEWLHLRLPKNLAELSPEFNIDPINGKEFTYKVANGAYELSSQGIPYTGEIKLVESPATPPVRQGSPEP